MTTPITKKIGSAGGGTRDASTWVGFVALLPADLVAADQQWTAEFYNDSNSFVVGGGSSCSGHTTDLTRFIKFTAAASNSFADDAGKLTNPLRYDQSKGVGLESNGGFASDAFTFGDNYTVIDRLQFYSNYVSHNYGVVLSGTNCTIKNSILYRGSVYGSSSPMLRMNGANGTSVNVLVLTDSINSDAGIAPEDSGVACINCTVIYSNASPSSRAAFANAYGHPLIRNCAAFGFTDFGRTGVALSASSDYDATDIASPSNMPGTHNLTSRVASTEWTTTGASYDARPKATTTLAVGTRDQTYTNDLDIIGQTRSTTSPTIGAFEYVAAGGGGSAVSSTGASTVIATGAALAAAPITSTGAATVTAAGKALAAATITSTGASTLAFVGQALASATISATGVATAAFTGQSLASAPITSTGAATALFVGTSTSGGAAAATITGQSTAIFTGQATDAAAISAAGASTVIAGGAATAKASFAVTGASTATFVGTTVAATIVSGAFSAAGQSVVHFKGTNGSGGVNRNIIDGRPHIRRRKLYVEGNDLRDILAIIEAMESGQLQEAA